MSFDLLGAPFPALASWLDDLGVGARHAPRVFRGLHRDRVPLDAVPDLGRHAAVIAAASVRAQVDVAARHPAADGNVRLVFGLHDGARVEGVLLPTRGSDRVTLCLSSQVGCAMACAFCATGTLGLTRDLTAGVWVGNDDNTPMEGVTGGTLPASIWRKVMLEAFANSAVRSGADSGATLMLTP